MKQDNSRGGFRENAGRKKNEIEKKVLQIRLTHEEVLKVKEYVRMIRNV